MSDEYSVIVAGKVIDGFTVDQVKANVSKLFSLDGAKVSKLFSGKPIALRRGLSKERATKLRAALTNAGMLAVVKADKVVIAAPDKKPQASLAAVRDDIECPRCGHHQAFAKACKLCKMDLSLHILRLERREQMRKVRQQRQAQCANS